MSHTYIDQPGQLESLCNALQGASLLAVDTEFVRTRSYYAGFGLLQVARIEGTRAEHVSLVDPQAGLDLSHLWQCLQQQPLVMHSASEDLEVIFHESDWLPEQLLDTQIAAAFAGHSSSAGFAAMVETFTGLTLDKGSARTDWLKRPLTAQQLSYAAADVIHLPAIYQPLMEQVEARGFSEHFKQECQRLVERKRRAIEHQASYRDIKNAALLEPNQLVVLDQLARWRQQQAQKRNLALNFVVREQGLFSVAQALPTSERDLRKLELLPQEIRHHGKTLLKLVEVGLNRPEADWPAQIRLLIDQPEYKKELARLRTITRTIAEENGLAPEFLASKKLLNQYLSWCWFDDRAADRLPQVMQGWRFDMLGSQF